MDPSDLVPGEESEILLWLSCDWAREVLGVPHAERDVLVVIADVSGRTEEVARPDGTNPFETPAAARSGVTARKPTAAGPSGSARTKPR